MRMRSVGDKWKSWGPQIQAILRIVAALTFILAGTVKLFAFPVGVPPAGGTVSFPTEAWFAGVLEVFGGAMLLMGMYTRPVAFILSGEMAVAYFQYHAFRSFWPVVNGGLPAMLYCFLWFYFSAAGAGAWSVDALRLKKQVRDVPQP